MAHFLVDEHNLSDHTGFSLGKINGIIKGLSDKELVDDLVINDRGVSTLEPYVYSDRLDPLARSFRPSVTEL